MTDDEMQMGDAPGARMPLALAALLGGRAAPLEALAARAGETLLSGLESVVAQRPELDSVRVDEVDGASVAADFADIDHMALDLRLSLANGNVHPLIAVVPLADLGALFVIDTSPEQMVDDEFARAQMEMLSAGVKELLDLAGLLLFVDGMAGAEITLQQMRLRAAGEALTALAAVTDGAPLLRLVLHITLPDGLERTVTVVLPRSLVEAVAEAVAPHVPLPGSPPPAAPPSTAGGGAPQPPAVERAEPAWEPAPANGAGAVLGGQGVDGADVHPARFSPINPAGGAPAPNQLDLIMDVALRVSVELGRTRMTVEEVLDLGNGSVVELNKLAGEPVDILVNDALIARGEVVVVDENFGVRVTEIVSPRTRAQAMARS